MRFFLFIFLLFFIYLIYKVVKVSMHVNRAFHDAYRQQDNTESYTNSGRRKVFQKDEGEYVDFEDISTDDNTSTKPQKEEPQEKFADESQVSDAEFEEIK
jgi:hypothetical protein